MNVHRVWAHNPATQSENRIHDDEVARFVDWFTRAFEPVLMAVLGVAIGFVVVLMYMPIFELAGNIK